MTIQQRKILTIVLSFVVLAAAIAGGILGVQGTKDNQAGEKPTRQAATERAQPTPAAPTAPPTEVPPSKLPPQAKPYVPSPSAAMPGQTQQPSTQSQQPIKPAPATTPAPSKQVTPGGKGAGPEVKIRFLELGAEWCGPCRSMKPIIEDLKDEYEDKVEFQSIDIDQNKDAAQKYNVSAIPVQLIFQNDKQVFRHVGSLSKDDIVKQFKKLGITPAK